jgi:heterodisulfide reductase subunit A
MITAKQAGLTQEGAPGTDVTVFTMDVRTTGKGYERYFERVATLPGVTYRRGWPSAVHELPGSQNLRLLTPDGGPGTGEEEFELLVLAVGMGPSESVQELAAQVGVTLDPWGFVVPGDHGPGTTSRPGVFVAGSALAPADVPETVTQSEAAAALAAAELISASSPSPGRDARPGTEALGVRSRALVGNGAGAQQAGELEEAGGGWGGLDEPPRIGLFLCTCHGALERTLDFAALITAGSQLRGVGHVQKLDAACEVADLAAIEEAAAEHDLNRIVIAGCSPHIYADQFDALMSRLGLPLGPEGHLLARANIREGAAWACGGNGRVKNGAESGFGEPSAPDPGLSPACAQPVSGPTAVARGNVAMAVAGLRETPNRPLHLVPPREGRRRVLVLGGGLAGMSAAITLADLGIRCDVVERRAELGGNLLESVHTLDGLDAQALLSDTLACLRQADRVRVWTEAELVGWSGLSGDFEAQIDLGDELHLERYGALIVATGAEPAVTSEYLYGEHPRVVTQRELELQIEDWRLRDTDQPAAVRGPSPGQELRSVVMIQCVGFRDEAHPYCSRVCCAHAIKNALALKELDPSIEVTILFRDVRTMGTRELYYQQARRLGVRFLRYAGPAEADSDPLAKPLVEVAADGGLQVSVHDTLYDDVVVLDADLLALSTGIVPPAMPLEGENARLAEMLGVELDRDGFFAEAHPKMRPTDFAHPGIFLCGMAYGPRFISESITQARAAALRAALLVARPLEVRREVAAVEEKLCSFCGLCVTACPYSARVLDDEERFARVVDHLCQGCGVCVAVCPNGASRQPAFEAVRALAMVDAALIE